MNKKKNIWNKKLHLFLDFDGVLHPIGKHYDRMLSRLPILLDFLYKQHLNKVDVKIVFTTDWQIQDNFEQLKNYLIMEFNYIKNNLSKIQQEIKEKVDFDFNIKFDVFTKEVFKNMFEGGIYIDEQTGKYDHQKDKETRYDGIVNYINKHQLNIEDCLIIDDNIHLFPPINIHREKNYDWKDIYFENYEKYYHSSFQKYIKDNDFYLKMNNIFIHVNSEKGISIIDLKSFDLNL